VADERAGDGVELLESLLDPMDELADKITEVYARTGVLWNVDRLAMVGEIRTVRTKTGISLFRVKGTARVEGETEETVVSVKEYNPEAVDVIAQVEASRIWGTANDVLQAKMMITALLAGTRDARKVPELEKEWDDEGESPKWPHALSLALVRGGHPGKGARQLTMRTYGWLEALYEMKVAE